MKYISLCVLVVFGNVLFLHAQSLPKPQTPAFKKTNFNIISYGAKADGISLNTKSINAAIEDCNKKGGGVVIIPKGLWLTGPIVLRSNVNLHLERNTLLQFTTDYDQCPLVKGNCEGLAQMRNQSPLSANEAVNIAITGFDKLSYKDGSELLFVLQVIERMG